jgi:hypothetical protein
MTSIIITRRIVLPVMVTIVQLCIDRADRVEILVYDQNRFIRSQIRKDLKKSRTLTKGGGLLLL